MNKLIKSLWRVGANSAKVNQVIVSHRSGWLSNVSPLCRYGTISNDGSATSKTTDRYAPKNTSKALKNQERAGRNLEKITLRGTDNSITIITLDEAHKLAKRRDLKVVKETDFDGKSQRPVYRLTTISKIKAEVLQESSSHETTAGTTETKPSKASPAAAGGVSSQIKGDKLLNINSKIAENDLQSRLKHIQKWLLKQYKVIVVINGTDTAAAEKIFQQIEATSKGLGRVLQKRNKGGDLRFQVAPLKEQQQQTQPPSSSSSQDEPPPSNVIKSMS